ncbi:MAG: dienelactone hydrolase family protein [Cyanobacteria bacterium SZAS-4]|nr:dienelactone hydrolase family protein [Cyanobacteria bacterium SZAS-4]
MAEIEVDSAQHHLHAYLKEPEGSGPWPGVVVLHDIFGMSGDCRNHVDWFASSGYIAIAPDLFSWGNKLMCIRSVFQDIVSQSGPSFEDIEAMRTNLAARKNCTGKVGVIGFCMGGSFALLTAQRGFSASSINYGRMPEDLDPVLKGACPVIGSFGAVDPTLPGAAAKLENALERANVPHDVKEYPNASHGFLNDHHGFAGWIVNRVGMGHHGPSATDTQARILKFFGEHLH